MGGALKAGRSDSGVTIGYANRQTAAGGCTSVDRAASLTTQHSVTKLRSRGSQPWRDRAAAKRKEQV